MSSFILGGRRWFLTLGIVVPLVVFALACGPGEEPTATKAPAATVAVPTPTAVATPTPTPTGGVPKRGGSMIQYGAGYPANWDMQSQCCPVGMTNLTKLYLTIMYDDGPTKAKQFVCDLCQNWYLENAGKTIVFQLRGDATFHDGKPITSRDMKYSLEKLMGKLDGVAQYRVGWMNQYIDTIETPDDRTAKVNLHRAAPVIPPLFTVGMSTILPEGTKSADLNQPPLGPTNKHTSGPFYLKEAVKDSHVLLERYPNYFKKGLPYLDSIKMQTFTDGNAATTALLTGKIDLWIGYGKPAIQFIPKLFQQKEDGKLGLVRLPFGMTNGTLYLRYTNPLFDDIRVRQALNLAMDREEWGNAYFDGLFVGSTLFAPGTTSWSRPEDKIWNVLPGWGTGAKKQEEIQQAKDLLKQAGYATGLNLPFMTTATAPFKVEVIQRQMIKVGINATLEVVEGTVQTQRQGIGQFVVHLWPSTHTVWDPDESIGSFFVTGAPRNMRGISDPWIDKQFLLMSSETDPDKRTKLFFEIEDYLLEKVYYTPGPDGYQDYWYDAKLRGIEPGVSFLKVSSERGESWWLNQ